jgi:hypothetical protein
MADFKRNYNDAEVRSKHQLLVLRKELSTLSRGDDDKRTRAELLDAIEDLFQDKIVNLKKQSFEKDIDLESLRAILTMIVLSVTNSSDDKDFSTAFANAIFANTSKVTFPGFGTDSNTALRGNTPTISADQAQAIDNNTAKTGITQQQVTAINDNSAKRDARFIYQTFIANFNGNINSKRFVPLSDGETETTNPLTRRNNFIAPGDGILYKVLVRSNASLQSGGSGVTLTGQLHKYVDGNDNNVVIGSATTTTGSTARTNQLDFSSVNNNNFRTGDRLLVSLQAPLNANKNYYVTVVFKMDQARID